jgi:hypothetical protein
VPAKEHVKKIGLHDYKYLQMTMTPALELLSLLSAFVGDALAPLAKGGLELDEELDPDIIAQCVQAMMSKLGNSAAVLEIVGRLNARGLVAIADAKGQKSLHDLSKDAFADSHFGDHLGELPGWLMFALGAQFGDFFGSLGGDKLRALVSKATRAGSTSPSTSASAGPSSD